MCPITRHKNSIRESDRTPYLGMQRLVGSQPMLHGDVISIIGEAMKIYSLRQLQPLKRECRSLLYFWLQYCYSQSVPVVSIYLQCM